METKFRMVDEPPKKRGCFIRYSILAVAVVLVLVVLIAVAIVAAFFGPGRKNSASEEHSQGNQTEMKHTSPLSCDVAIVGGGISGLYVAETLLRLQKETNVCLFEREDRFGGRVRDFSFQRLPDIPISLGAWLLDKTLTAAWEIMKRFNLSYDLIAPSHDERLEGRGIFVTDRDSYKEAFPALNKGQFQNSTYIEIVGYLFNHIDKVGNFSSVSSFASEFLTPEGWQYFADVRDFKPDYERETNAEALTIRGEQAVAGIYSKPVKGMSVLTEALASSAIQLGAKFYKGEKVRNIEQDEEIQFKLVTKSFAVTAKKLVLAVPVEPMKQITGSVTEKIQNNLTFQSVNAQVAFKGFAVYEEAWWQRNSTGSRFLADEQIMRSYSDCLGNIFSFKQRGPRGEAILQTSYAKYTCGVKWGEMLKISKTTTDEEIHRALERLFPGVNIPKPLESVYVYWEEGFIHLQRAGTHIPLKAVADWAKRPIQGKDVFVVGEAYADPMRGWTEGALLSAQNALREGWGIDFEDSGRKKALKRKRSAEMYSDIDLFP